MKEGENTSLAYFLLALIIGWLDAKINRLATLSECPPVYMERTLEEKKIGQNYDRTGEEKTASIENKKTFGMLFVDT